MILILADALITRMGWKLPKLALARPVKEPRTRKVRVQDPAIPIPALKEQEQEPQVSAAPVVVKEEVAASQRKERFARAKKR
jgi:hypothetical protein